jgi:tetratricopeptide (TPR) repeat protein
MSTRTTLPAGLAGLLASLLLASPAIAAGQGAPVTVKEEKVVIPAYLAGEPEKSPMFYFGRQSQGAEGRIYPYPLYDTLTGKKVEKTYTLVTLENEYVRIGILPEIGGRLFEAIDKTNGYHFFYRQHVIKPALIGLIGAWISGGIEWNIPHHHRASTFLPVQHRVEENPDGSKTVWVGELELRHRMRWAVGYTLHPGRSYLEAKVRIVNRTPVVNTMLCFANAAVHATQDYQVIFPPSTKFVTHHHKREFTTWPIATTRYGGYDFRPGTDVSWFRNHQAANSMFAWNYEDDFFAGYDHGKHAGTMSVADHRIVPGKKLWTWGNGPRGRMWDKILTDEDGPYIELMTGAYSDNQPDYSWLQPFEAKVFSMYWYPFREIGGVKKANLDAAVNLEVGADGKTRLGFCTTASYPEVRVSLFRDYGKLLDETVAIGPGKPYVKEFQLPPGTPAGGLHALLALKDRSLIEYYAVTEGPQPMPSPDRPPPSPAEIKTTEELYLTGLRIEQFHDPDRDPEPYWEEAFRRDPGDTRVHTALGIRELKAARYESAEAHFRKALERLTAGYAAPNDGEALYYLGLSLKARGQDAEAARFLAKATWSAAWRGPAYYELAELSTARGDFAAALADLDRSLESNALNSRAMTLKAATLRHLGRADAAREALVTVAKSINPLDMRTMAERWLLTKDLEDALDLGPDLHNHGATALETAAEYQSAGLWEDGLEILEFTANDPTSKSQPSPLVFYDQAYFLEKLGREQDAVEARKKARAASPDRVFPFQAEMIPVLRDAMMRDRTDPRAPYYLGNLLFDWQPDEAVKCWEQSAALDPSFPMVHRNLAIAWSHRPSGNDLGRAIAAMEKAVSPPDASPSHFAELDELYAAAARPPEQRLKMLATHQDKVAARAEALSREIALLILAGRYDEAIRLMTGRRFEVWEGGSLSVADDWVSAHVLRANLRRIAGRFEEALADLKAAGRVPENLPSDRGGHDRAAEIAYVRGLVHESAGDRAAAVHDWQEVAGARPHGARGRFCQGRALHELGRRDDEEAVFRGLSDEGRRRLEDAPRIDPGASASVQQSRREQLAEAYYMAALGALGVGQGEPDKALAKCLEVQPDHLGAKTELEEQRRASGEKAGESR